MKTRRIKKGLAVLLAAVMCLAAAPASSASAEEHARAGGARDFANVVLFAYFQDETEPDFFNETSPEGGSMTAVQNIVKYYDGEYGRSFVNYMDTISYGQFKVHNIFPQYDEDTKTVEAIKLPYSKATAQSENIDYNVIKHICEQGIPEISETVDYDGDGAIDNVSIVLVGSGSNTTQSIPTLYPHKDIHPGSDSLAGKSVSSYNMLNTDRMFSDESGLICHEFLHTLGYSDLYTRDGSLPVYNWDIMGQSSLFVAQPLAYSKMHFTGWVTLDTIDTSRNGVTLDASFENGGKQAYIIKAPNNPYELFVVERRTQGDRHDENSLDAAIGGSGIIVYRVDTTVSGLSNYSGKNGVYIFRPQEGQNGFVAGSERLTLNNAYLSAESGRTSIGTSDLNQGLEDGALTFSDGTNSGIVISNVSSSADGKMQFDVSIPEASQYDLWADTGFNQGADYTHTALMEVEGEQIAAAYKNQGEEIKLFVYRNEIWENYGSAYSDQKGVSGLQLFTLDGDMGIAYGDGEGNLHIAVYNGTEWRELTADSGIQNVNAFDVEEGADRTNAHLVYVRDNKEAFYSVVSSDGISGPELYFSDSLIGNPEVLVTEDNVYTTVRNADTHEIRVYAYGGTGEFQEIDSPGQGSAYDMIAYNNELYYATGSTSDLSVRKYSGNTWSDYASLKIDSFTPEMVVAQGNLYILTIPAGSDETKGLRAYAVADGQITQEGVKIDTGGTDYSMTASKDTLFVGYTKNDRAYVKKKTTVNSLLSLTVIPPDKTSYLVGDSVVYDGLKVYANYVNGQRELAWGEYSVTDFDTGTAGEKTAIVSFGGLSNTFAYSVLQEVEPELAEITDVTITDLDVPQGGSKPDTEAAVKENGMEIESISWQPPVTGDKFEYDEQYEAVILLRAESGYTFSNTVKAAVTGAEKAETQITADRKLQITVSYAKTAVPEITVEPDSMDLAVGETRKLNVSDETGSALVWSSGDPDIASVEQDGSVTGVKAGSTTIMVRNMYGKQAQCTVTVRSGEIHAENAELTADMNPSVLYVGQVHTIKITVTPENIIDDVRYTYKSSDNEIVSVSGEGAVSALKKGTAEITIIVKAGSFTKELIYKIDVKELPSGSIAFKQEITPLEEGQTAQLEILFSSEDETTGKTVTWSSSDETVATVDGAGLLTAVKAGKTVITARADGKEVAYELTVIEKKTQDSGKTPPTTGNTGQDIQNSGKGRGTDHNSVVQTGDTNNLFGVVALMVLSILTVAGTVVFRNRKNQ